MVPQREAPASVAIRIFPAESSSLIHRVELSCSDGELQRGKLDAANRPSSAADLFSWLMADTSLAKCWAELRGRYSRRCVRLHMDLDADLHQLPWEAMVEPGSNGSGAGLAEQESTPFLRYWEGRSPEPVNERPVRVLVAIADPEDIEDDGLTPIDRETEWRDIRATFERIDPGNYFLKLLDGPCTLAAIGRELRSGAGHHILHFIGHGRVRSGHTFLYLARDAFNRVEDPTEDRDVARMFGNLLGGGASLNPLRMVVLQSCETASISGAAGLAPRLLEAGVPTVLAMHGKVSVRTARQFCRVFYEELFSHGEADTASNRARATLRAAKHSGGEMPVLYSRRKDGRVLAAPERQVDLEGLHRFLSDNLDERGLARVAARLGVADWQPGGDKPDQARSLINLAKSEGRIDILLAEAIEQAPGAESAVKRKTLQEELRSKVSPEGPDAKSLQWLEGRAFNEKHAAKLLSDLGAVLSHLAEAKGRLDDSPLFATCQRLSAFLSKPDGGAEYQFRVAVAAVPWLLQSAELTALPAADVAALRSGWETVTRRPIWQRPQALAAFAALLLFGVFVFCEWSWRKPFRIFPSGSASLDWRDQYNGNRAAEWECGDPPADCNAWLRSSRFHIPAGKWIARRGGLYDFGLRFRVRLEPGTNSFSWSLRSFGPKEYRFTLHRKKEAAPMTNFWLESQKCAGGDCAPFGDPDVRKASTECAADAFQIVTAIEGRQVYTKVSAEIDECGVESVTPISVDNAWRPWSPAGRIRIGGAAGGPVSLIGAMQLFTSDEGIGQTGLKRIAQTVVR